MAAAETILLVVAFVAGLAVVFLVATAVRKWVFELSPREWGYSMILAFSLGALLVAYLVGDALLELLSMVPIFLATVWWISRLWHRHEINAAARERA